MAEKENIKKYDLEDRTFHFAANIRAFVKKLTKTISNIEDGKQLVRASGSVAANYIEANESLSDRDFLYRVKICRKEAKESRLFLRLIDISDKAGLEKERDRLINEATELMKIFGSMIVKIEKKN